jgi:hypothetical protein
MKKAIKTGTEKNQKEKFITPHEYLDKHVPKEAHKDLDTFFEGYYKSVREGRATFSLPKVRSLLKEAKRRGICAYCGKEVDKSLMDKSDLEENEISGMCKPCLDKTFKEEITEDKEITKGVVH